MEVLGYSLVLFLIMILVIFLVARGAGYVEKSYKENAENESRAIKELDVQKFREALLKELNVEIKEGGGTDYVVSFQGGTFWFRFSEDNRFLKLSYPGFSEFKYEKYSKALRAQNTVNLKHYWTTCFTYCSDSENPIVANCDYLYALNDAPQKCAEVLRDILRVPFCVAREFHDEMNNPDEKFEMCAAELAEDVVHKMQYDSLRLQLDIVNAECKDREPKRITVARLLELSRDVDLGCLLSMRIIQGESVDAMTESEAILSFDFEDFLKERHDEHDRYTFLLDFEKESLAIDMHKMLGCDAKHLIYNMAVVHNGSYLQERCAPYNFRTLLEVHLTTREEDNWEARYMIEEMCDGAPFKEFLPHADERLHFSLYWGVRLYNKGAYLQALEHLKKVYHGISDPTEATSTKMFCFVSEMIGTIYMKLGMPETAYAYVMQLAMGMDFQHCYPLFAECLSAINEIAALDWLFKMRGSIVDTLNDREGCPENTVNIYFFINRKIVEMFIRRGKKAEAQEYLANMIKREEDVEWARKTLDNLLFNDVDVIS